MSGDPARDFGACFSTLIAELVAEGVGEDFVVEAGIVPMMSVGSTVESDLDLIGLGGWVVF